MTRNGVNIPAGMHYENLQLHKHFLRINSQKGVYIFANCVAIKDGTDVGGETSDVLYVAAGTWVIDCFRLLPRKYVERPVYNACIAWEQGEDVAAPVLTYTDIDTQSIAGLNGQRVYLNNDTANPVSVVCSEDNPLYVQTVRDKPLQIQTDIHSAIVVSSDYEDFFGTAGVAGGRYGSCCCLPGTVIGAISTKTEKILVEEKKRTEYYWGEEKTFNDGLNPYTKATDNGVNVATLINQGKARINRKEFSGDGRYMVYIIQFQRSRVVDESVYADGESVTSIAPTHVCATLCRLEAGVLYGCIMQVSDGKVLGKVAVADNTGISGSFRPLKYPEE